MAGSSLPELSEERRKDVTKIVKKEAEEAKVGMRNVRRDAIEVLKKQKADKVITEDIEKMQDKKVQELDRPVFRGDRQTPGGQRKRNPGGLRGKLE